MIRVTCNDGDCSFESKGLGLIMVAECIEAIRAMYSGISDRSEKLGEMLKYVLIEETNSGRLFEKSKEKPEDSEPEDKPLSVEDDEQLMEEIRENIKELTRKLMEE